MHQAPKVHVEPVGSEWLVVREGESQGRRYGDRDAAIQAAVGLAREAEVRIHLTDPEWSEGTTA
jgi:hypothetical protein